MYTLEKNNTCPLIYIYYVCWYLKTMPLPTLMLVCTWYKESSPWGILPLVNTFNSWWAKLEVVACGNPHESSSPISIEKMEQKLQTLLSLGFNIWHSILALSSNMKIIEIIIKVKPQLSFLKVAKVNCIVHTFNYFKSRIEKIII